MSLKSKYFKPKSVTWWASVAPIVAGIVLIIGPDVPPLMPVAELIQRAYPGVTPITLINIGLAGVGVRGAMQ